MSWKTGKSERGFSLNAFFLRWGAVAACCMVGTVLREMNAYSGSILVAMHIACAIALCAWTTVVLDLDYALCSKCSFFCLVWIASVRFRKRRGSSAGSPRASPHLPLSAA